MASRRDDYLIRMIEQLRQFVAEALRRRESGQLDLALVMLMQAQEKLFARPTAGFIALPLDEQLRLLTLDEPPETAREKTLLYAELLKEASKVYRARDQRELATSALQLALQVTLIAAIASPSHRETLRLEAAALLGELTPELSPDELHAPVQALLAELGLAPRS
ncbi:MAG TPA: hypothetical protein VGD81_10700 [Opitutaceae bacterium]